MKQKRPQFFSAKNELSSKMSQDKLKYSKLFMFFRTYSLQQTNHVT